MEWVEIPVPADVIQDRAGNVRVDAAATLKIAGTATDATHAANTDGDDQQTGGLITRVDGTIGTFTQRRYVLSGTPLDCTVEGHTRLLQPVAARGQGFPDLLAAKDIWPAMDDSAPLGDQVDIETYARYIAAITDIFGAYDLELELEGHGQADTAVDGEEDESLPIYSLTAGMGTYEVLLITGVHGNESAGRHGMFRFMESFVSAPELEWLRSQCRIKWLCFLNPANYRVSKWNARGVDLGRNQDYMWGYFEDQGGGRGDEPGGANHYKGTSAASEAETRLLDTILDEEYDLVLDGHDTTGYASSVVQIAAPSSWIPGVDRGLAAVIAGQWRRAYAEDVDDVIVNYYPDADPFPHGTNYAAWKAFEQGRQNANAFLLECRRDFGGATNGGVTPQPLLKRYVGLVTTTITAYILHGQAPAVPGRWLYSGRRITADHATSVTVDGTLIDNAIGGINRAQVTFDYVRPAPPGKPFDEQPKTQRLLIPRPFAGTMEVVYWGDVVSTGWEQRLDFCLLINGTVDATSYSTCHVPAVPGMSGSFKGSTRVALTPSNEDMNEVRIAVERNTTAGTAPKLVALQVDVILWPNLYGDHHIIPGLGNIEWGQV